MRLGGSDCVAVTFTSSDPDQRADLGHPDLAVADLAGAGGLDHRVDNLERIGLGHEDLDLDLGNQVDGVLRAAVDLGVAPLAAEALDLTHGEPLDAEHLQRRLHVIQLKGLMTAVINFMRAYREAMDYLFDPRNREICEALLIANDPGMTPALAKKTYDIFVHPKSGLFRDLALDMEGVATALDLRSKYGVPQKTLTDPMKYVDLNWHQKAFGGK